MSHLDLHSLIDLALIGTIVYTVYRYEHMRTSINKNFEHILDFLAHRFSHKSAPQAPSAPNGPVASQPTTEEPQIKPSEK